MAHENSLPRGKKKAAESSRRKHRVRDERLLSPVFVDHSTLAIGKDLIIHSMYQTEIPVGNVSTAGPIDSVLVGRFVYGADYFRSLTVMFARQYIASEVERNKGDEAFKWYSRN